MEQGTVSGMISSLRVQSNLYTDTIPPFYLAPQFTGAYPFHPSTRFMCKLNSITIVDTYSGSKRKYASSPESSSPVSKPPATGHTRVKRELKRVRHTRSSNNACKTLFDYVATG